MKVVKIIALLWVIAFLVNITIYYTTDYKCAEMSKTWEKYLERIGIKTYVVVGYKFNGNVTFSAENGVITGFFADNHDFEGHVWLLIDLFGIKIPFDCVTLTPINPDWIRHYDMVKVTEGYYDGNKKITDTVSIFPY